MVGTLEKGKTLYALVRTPEQDIYQVRQGNHMGQNFGVIVGIGDTDIKLKELVQDGRATGRSGPARSTCCRLTRNRSRKNER